jgi:hypothetical protein
MECWQQRAGSTVPGPKPGTKKTFYNHQLQIQLYLKYMFIGMFFWFLLHPHIYFQRCTCLAFAPGQLPAAEDLKEKSKVCLPPIVAGYSDGTVRMFDVNKEEMVLKMHPHAVSVTAISFSSDGRRI